MIKYAILGFLSWRPLTGYDLKKLFAESLSFYWSGNSNQVYPTLVQLGRDGLVTSQVEQGERLPARKVYTITDAGRAELRQWLLSSPELPQVRDTFLVQLAWADQLSPDELDHLLGAYEEEIRLQLLMNQEEQRRGGTGPARTPREAYLWKMIAQNRIGFYAHELEWVRTLREELSHR